MYLKLFVCVLLVSHALAEEEDDGQYSPEKYEKPYEEIPNDEVDESQQPLSPVQQTNVLNPGQYQQNALQQTVPQGYQPQKVVPQGLPNTQAVPEAYNQIPQQQIVPQAYQQLPPQHYQQHTLPQSYQQPLVEPQADQKVYPQLYQQFLQQQKTLSLPQTYQQYAQYQDFSQQSASQFQQNPVVSYAYQQSTQQNQQDSTKPVDQSTLSAPLLQQNQQQIAPNSNDQSLSINQNSIPMAPQAPAFQQTLPLVATNYETDNGHRRTENVDSEGNVVGQYSYVDPSGKTLTVRYSAGKDGFKVEGDHLPVAPQAPAVPLPDAPSIPQYNPQTLSASIQSQINPTVANLPRQELQSALQQNFAPSNPQAQIPTVTANSALRPQVPYNLYNPQVVQPQLQYSLQHLYGQTTPGQTPVQTPSVSQYALQQLYNQQTYPANVQPQLKHNPSVAYNFGPQPGQLLQSPQ